MTDWIGEQGMVKKFSCSYRGMNFPGEAFTCRGKVIKKYVADGKHYVQCEIWIENPKGEKTVSEGAVVIMPSRSTPLGTLSTACSVSP